MNPPSLWESKNSPTLPVHKFCVCTERKKIIMFYFISLYKIYIFSKILLKNSIKATKN